jgi:hypothetical protein
MKRFVYLVVIILLVGGVLYEEKHRAATTRHSPAEPASEYPDMDLVLNRSPSHFADMVDLWNPPRVKIADTDSAFSRLMVQQDLSAAQVRPIHLRPEIRVDPVLTVADRELRYALISAGDFRLTLDLKPAFATPEALLPDHIDPGIGASFKF